MDELMLHVLDLAMNAIAAEARLVKVSIHEDFRAGTVCLAVIDDGRGMTAEQVTAVREGYATSKVKQAGWKAFGVALLQGNVDLVGGQLDIASRPGLGTMVRAVLPLRHPDRPPLGRVASSLQSLLVCAADRNVCFTHRLSGPLGAQGYRLDTRPVRRELGEAYATAAVRAWLVEQVRAGEAELDRLRERLEAAESGGGPAV